MTNIPDIEYGNTKEYGKITPFVDSQNSLYQLPFYKGDEYFSNIDSLTKFIKACERLVRSSDRYTKYKAYLMTEGKMDHCQVFKDVTTDDADIEMHHGPIFTLFDYTYMVLSWFLRNKKKITTYRVADTVLKEHEENHIQVVMLSKTIHEEVHERNIFINTKQAFGDLATFMTRYAPISRDMLEKYNRYIDRSMVSDSNDFDKLIMTKCLVHPEEMKIG